jgi:hypothetical protein
MLSQPISSPMIKTMLGRCCCCATACGLAAVIPANAASRPTHIRFVLLMVVPLLRERGASVCAEDAICASGPDRKTPLYDSINEGLVRRGTGQPLAANRRALLPPRQSNLRRHRTRRFPRSRQDACCLPRAHCWLTKRINAPAAINTASRIPTTNEITGCRLSVRSFDLAPSCAAPMPNQKRSLSIAVSAVIGAALWRPYYAYDYGELPHSVSAKSPNPGQGYLAQRRRER